jgi:hypothetical protein
MRRTQVLLSGCMSSSRDDRLLFARIAAISGRHARWRPLTEAEEADAIAELAEAAAGRADLLAECAGLALGCHEDGIDAPKFERAAGLCVKAGADATAIPRWIEEGRRRAAAARAIPYTG